MTEPVTSPIFRPFDPDGDVRIYIRNLPHWRQKGATYFVTLRQADSIPENVLTRWFEDRKQWYRQHNLDPQTHDSAPEAFVAAYAKIPKVIRREFERKQAKMLHEELDQCHGSCVLRRTEVQKEITSALKHFDGERLWLGDFVTMPNHVHAILQSLAEWDLEDLLGSIKKFTARNIGVLSDLTGAGSFSQRHKHNNTHFWQYESYDRIIRDAEELVAFRRYIFRNPDTARIERTSNLYYAADWLNQYAPSATWQNAD